MCANLVHAQDDSKLYLPVQNYLTGTIVSSLHRLKDIDNTGKCFSFFYWAVLVAIMIIRSPCFPRALTY
jgi:hypothetical protein